MKRLYSKRSNRQSWPIKVLTANILIGVMTTLVLAPANSATNTLGRKAIGDLEIYKAAKPGTASIFMMLDTSGSMDRRSIRNDYGTSFNATCTENSVNSEKISAVIYERKLKLTPSGEVFKDNDGKTVKILDLNNIKETINFTPKGCTASRTVRYSRLTRLQIALIELLADKVYDTNKNEKDTGALPDDYAIGLGNYSYNGDGRTGVVLVPTMELTAEQRVKLIKQVQALEATGGTPTAHALAESGAYMMGTATAPAIKVVGERRSSGWFGYDYRQCISNLTSLTLDSNLGSNVYACANWSRWSDSSSVIPSYDTLRNNIYYSGGSPDSGFINSVETAKKQGENNYISPLSLKECSGNGIYLLTDGQPELRTLNSNGTNSNSLESLNGSSNRAKALMNTSLLGATSPLSVNSCNGLSGGSNSGAWGCMAEYAALLRNPVNNPLRLPIKTATVGFGKDFAGLTGKRTIAINGESKEVIDCNSGSSDVDANTRNLCKLGERRGDNETKTFGDGGFYYTEESNEIAASIADFSSSLVQIINTAPSGTITIPEDPYRAANQLPYAYLPMLDPNIASTSSIWRGNLKKYALDQGTLFGNNDNLLYKDVAGNLNENTQDLWQTTDFQADGGVANNNISAGGVYAQLSTPSSDLGSVRTIYVEDTLADKKTPVLRKLSVDSSGKPQGFDKLVDTEVYNKLNQYRLLSFLGFSNVLANDGQPNSTKEVKSLTLTRPTKETKVLGGVVHSKPAAISYSANLDENGRITDTRDDYVLFGSMDGALHLVDADNGKEEVAIIPKFMMIAQPEALVDGSNKAKVGEPYFGVDAPWLVTTDYNYDLESDTKTVTVDTSADKGMFAYGGLRMGGEAFYGMNITKKAAPEILFTITSAGLSSSTATKSKTVGFERLGQIWSKPTAAKIRMSKDADPIDVLVFGGGYDMNYEDDGYVPTSSAQAKGNAIYMIDAQTGELIWSTSGVAGSTKNTKTDSMINSIVGGITVLDRDNDGLIDHLYAVDLGGQVFRADFENARPAKFGFTEVSSFSNKRITRVLNVAPTGANKKYAYRFYERPVVSFYRNEGISGQTIANNGKLFALVNVISGNRSAPLSTLRNSNNYANRVYGIIDSDVTSPDLYKTEFTPIVKDLTEDSLVNLATTLGAEPSEAQKNTAKVDMITGSKHGWYYPLTRFDGYNNVRHNKGVGDSAVINNLLYTTVYNPDKQYGTVASCAAKIMGGSERQLYCLPYGICMDTNSESGTGGYIPAGQGIQELTLGAFNKDNTDIKVLIGTTTLADRITATKRAGYGEDGAKSTSNIKDLYPGEDVRPTEVGGDGSASEFLFNERYTLQPRAWYERKQ